MKKTINSEDNLDDADELRKKKPKTEEVTDQMVPVPDSSPLRKEDEPEYLESGHIVKNDEINLPNSKHCKNVHETQELPNLDSMYEDVNSPEDFDDYDDEILEYHNSEKSADITEIDNKVENSVAEDLPDNSNIDNKSVNCFLKDTTENARLTEKPEECITVITENTSVDTESENCIADNSAEVATEDHEPENHIASDSSERARLELEAGNCIDDNTAENVNIECEPENFDVNDSAKKENIDHETDNYIADDTEETASIQHESDNYIADDTEETASIQHEPENYIAEDTTENSSIDHEQRRSYISDDTAENVIKDHDAQNYHALTEDVAISYEAEVTNVSYKGNVGSKNGVKENLQDTYVTEDSSLPSSDASLVRRDESPFVESAPTICSTASVEDDIDVDTEDDGVERDVNNIGYSFNREDEVLCNHVESQMDYAAVATAGERGIVPEVEDVTCDSGGDTVLVMKHEICSEDSGVSKPNNLCTVEEIAYTDQFSSIESVDKMIFHSRNSVIESGSASASLHASDSRGLKCGDSRFLCAFPEREPVGMVRHHNNYPNIVNSGYQKRVYNTVHISSVPESSDREFYGYDSSLQNMMLCRNNTVIDASTVPMPSNLNGFESYSFHRVPVEPPPCIKNVNDSYGHNTGFCPVIQNSKFEFTNSNVTSVKKLPSEEDFMRRIEKTLFESKIENKINDTLDSKYKSEVDLSLPLKKRLRTLAAISNITCTPEKFDAPKEDSFPSYPVKPMISIAELEFTEALIPKPGNIYQDNYK